MTARLGILLVSLVVVATISACQSPPVDGEQALVSSSHADETTHFLNERYGWYTQHLAAASHRSELLTPFLALDADPTGAWGYRHSLEYTRLDFRAAGSNTFDLTLETAGCLGGWTLARTVTASNAVLRLDEVAGWYCSPPFRRLYMLRVLEGDFLLPETRLVHIEESVQELGAHSVPGAIVRWSLHRWSEEEP